MWVRVVMFANEQKKGAQTLSTVGRRDGKLPLHMAVINEAPLSVLQVWTACSVPCEACVFCQCKRVLKFVSRCLICGALSLGHGASVPGSPCCERSPWS